MKNARQTITLWVACGLLGCAEESPPPTVDEFMRNSVLLDATMVRCSQNRSSSKYEADCVNAREAINRMALAEEKARRAELEAQSERKRRALRRAQEAAAQARRQAAEARRRRQEADYLSQFESAPDGATGGTAQPNPVPGETLAPDPAEPLVEPAPVIQPSSVPAPAPEPASEEGTDLESIRQELKRRQGGQ